MERFEKFKKKLETHYEISFHDKVSLIKDIIPELNNYEYLLYNFGDYYCIYITIDNKIFSLKNKKEDIRINKDPTVFKYYLRDDGDDLDYYYDYLPIYVSDLEKNIALKELNYNFNNYLRSINSIRLKILI